MKKIIFIPFIMSLICACGGGGGGGSSNDSSFTGRWYIQLASKVAWCSNVGNYGSASTYDRHVYVHQKGKHITLTDDVGDVYEGSLNNNSGFTVSGTVDTGKSIGVFKYEVTGVKDGIGNVVHTYDGYFQNSTCQNIDEGTISRED